MKRIGIIGGGLAPHFNEAMANQVNLLSKCLNIRVITCNDIGPWPFMSYDQYTIFNSKYLVHRTPFLSLVNGSALFLVTKYYERIFDWIILPGGVESGFLEYLDSHRCVPLVPSICQLDDNALIKIQNRIPQFPFIIAQSKKTKDQLVELGADPKRVFLMYPLVDLTKYCYSDPPHTDEFRIVFASSPNMEVPGEDNFTDKGVPLLLEAFSDFLKYEPKSKLYLVWRGYYTRELDRKLDELKLGDSVEILRGFVDMPAIYARSHVTVIPYLNLKRSPDIPLSALESLACGRPVVATDVVEISDILTSQGVGVTSKTRVEDFSRALQKCRQNYHELQGNCIDLKIPTDIPLQRLMQQNTNE
jgi:glycosyltransferase involved in cell wall biosynthesis